MLAFATLIAGVFWAAADELPIRLENYAISSVIYSSTRAKALVGIVNRATAQMSFAECAVSPVNSDDSALHFYDMGSCTLPVNQWFATSDATIARFNMLFDDELNRLYEESADYVRLKLLFRDGAGLAAWLGANYFAGKTILPRMIGRGFYGGSLAAAGYALGAVNGMGIALAAYVAYRNYYDPLPSLESKVVQRLRGFVRPTYGNFAQAKQLSEESGNLYDLVVKAIQGALAKINTA
jgi:hypothetical protein